MKMALLSLAAISVCLISSSAFAEIKHTLATTLHNFQVKPLERADMHAVIRKQYNSDPYAHYYYVVKKKKARAKPQYTRPAYSFPSSRPGTGKRVFIFDPNKLMWAAYSPSGNLVKEGRASGGKGWCSDVKRSCRTPRGKFSVYSKGAPSCKSSKFPLGRGGAPMPYCMFFYKGFAIHGSPDVPNYNASHGCIRVLPSAARWLSHNFIKHGTTVIVKPY